MRLKLPAASSTIHRGQSGKGRWISFEIETSPFPSIPNKGMSGKGRWISFEIETTQYSAFSKLANMSGKGRWISFEIETGNYAIGAQILFDGGKGRWISFEIETSEASAGKAYYKKVAREDGSRLRLKRQKGKTSMTGHKRWQGKMDLV